MVMTRRTKRTEPTGASMPRMPMPGIFFAPTVNAGASLDVNIVLRLRSDARYLSLIRGVTQDICENVGFAGETTDGVKLAVGEAVANAMEHGSPNGRDDSVTVIFTKTDNSLRVEVIDQGTGMCFPINMQRCKRRNRGFGFVLMRNLMDTVEFIDSPKGTHLAMTKKLPS